MHKLYELKEHLCSELEEFAGKDLNSATLETVDKLAHAAKNVGKIIEMCESDYSERGSYGMSRGHSSYEDGSNDGSYARGRGRYAKRDSMGRYASDGYSRTEDMRDLTHEIKMMANYLPANKQQDLQKLVEKMEQM
jgi:hypothetical protein